MLVSFILFSPGCLSNQNVGINQNEQDNSLSSQGLVSAVDISYYPLISKFNHNFVDQEGDQIDFIDSLIQNGVNTVRLRIWHDPVGNSSSLAQVVEFSKLLKAKGLKIWLCPHYSDTWADPSQQRLPDGWKSLNFEQLKIEVYEYTQAIVNEVDPDFIQIGNEINNGLLFPHGEIHQNKTQFLEILEQGSKAVRDSSEKAKIILHYAGFESAHDFFYDVNHIDYDVVGISYYPIWHGKSISSVGSELGTLANNTGRDVIIAETAYPFTLGSNDWTDNILGLESQLILPGFPASPKGQEDFLRHLKEQIFSIESGIGFCYWGADMISWDGPESKNGSVWENQAVFDFENKELPVLQEFDLSHRGFGA